MLEGLMPHVAGAKKTFTKLTIAPEPLKDWGDPSCPGPIGDALAPHGTSISKRANGKTQLFVVNHGGRESIEMYEIKHEAATWSLAWHGCVVATQAYNDVATQYNTAQMQFPTNLVAGLAKSVPAELWEIEDAAERAVPNVDLGFGKPGA